MRQRPAPPPPPARGGILARLLHVRRRVDRRVCRAEFLRAVPFRCPALKWEMRADPDRPEGTQAVTLLVARRQDGIGRLLNRLFEAPAHREVALDALGSAVWRGCDGQATVEMLVETLVNEHDIQREQAEVSLAAYLRTLSRRGFLGFRGVDSDP